MIGREMDINRDNLVIVLLLFVFMALGCDGHSTVSGRVFDASGRPVVGAVVRLEEVTNSQRYNCKTETGPRGGFSCGFVHAPFSIPLRLSIAQTGFKMYQTEFTTDDAHKKLEAKDEFKIILEKE